MAEDQRALPEYVVDVLVAVDVPDVRPVCVVDVEGNRRETTCVARHAAGEDLLCMLEEGSAPVVECSSARCSMLVIGPPSVAWQRDAFRR